LNNNNKGLYPSQVERNRDDIRYFKLLIEKYMNYDEKSIYYQKQFNHDDGDNNNIVCNNSNSKHELTKIQNSLIEKIGNDELNANFKHSQYIIINKVKKYLNKMKNEMKFKFKPLLNLDILFNQEDVNETLFVQSHVDKKMKSELIQKLLKTHKRKISQTGLRNSLIKYKTFELLLKYYENINVDVISFYGLPQIIQKINTDKNYVQMTKQSFEIMTYSNFDQKNELHNDSSNLEQFANKKELHCEALNDQIKKIAKLSFKLNIDTLKYCLLCDYPLKLPDNDTYDRAMQISKQSEIYKHSHFLKLKLMDEHIRKIRYHNPELFLDRTQFYNITFSILQNCYKKDSIYINQTLYNNIKMLEDKNMFSNGMDKYILMELTGVNNLCRQLSSLIVNRVYTMSIDRNSGVTQ
jgi:hypothetical protein